MKEKRKGKKALALFVVLSMMFALGSRSTMLVARADDPQPDPVYDYCINIERWYQGSVKVEYEVNGGGFEELQGEEWWPGHGGYVFNLDGKATAGTNDQIHFRVTLLDPNFQFYTATLIKKNCTEDSDPQHLAPEDKVDLLTGLDPMTNVVEATVSIDDNAKLMNFDVGYANPGRADIIDQAKQYIYAYSEGKDYKNDGGATTDDLKYALAAELYGKFIEIDAFGSFGMTRPDGEDWSNWGVAEALMRQGIDELESRITLTPNGTISVKNARGAAENINAYTATVAWGNDEENGNPIQSVLNVYGVADTNQILICTDYNVNNGAGTSYYIRDARNDKVAFSMYPEDDALVVLDSFSNVVIGGHATEMDVLNLTDNYFTADLGHKNWNPAVKDDEDIHLRVRVMNPSADFIAVHGEGEDKVYDGMGLNGLSTDTIYETGDGLAARVYIGETTIHLSPVSAGLNSANAKITGVELVDKTQKDGVSIDASDVSDIKVSFASNFYDSVELKVSYGDGNVKKIVLDRVGLIIRYMYIDAFNNTGYIRHDCYGDAFPGLQYSYDYAAGEQIMIYATYYHPSHYATNSGDDDVSLYVTFGDGTTRVIGKSDANHGFANGYAKGDAYGAVDTTTFLIDFIPAHELIDIGYEGEMITKQNYKGGMHALVVNGGYNNDKTFGGAQVGSGAGVYWDGNVVWGF